MSGGSPLVVRISIGALAGIVLASGLARVGVVDSRSTSVAAVIGPAASATPKPAATASPTLLPTDSPASTPGTQDLPSSVPSEASTPDVAVTLPSLAPVPFVTSPVAQPTVPSDVKTDLSNRLPVFDELTALSDPEDSKFQTLAQFVAIFDVADRAEEKADLTAEGLQGVYYGVGVSTKGSRLYKITLFRFATAAGAATHLSHFVTRPADDEGLTGTATTVPGAHEFLGHTDNKAGAIDIYYLGVGRYFASAETIAPPSDKGARAQAKTLALAVRDSLQ